MRNVKIIGELKRLKRKTGLLLAEDVVEAARSKSSALHSRFEWSDSKAAHEHRLWQARQLISVCVEFEPGLTQPIHVFASLSSDRGRKGGGYRTTVEVLSDAEMREQMLKDALHDLNTLQLKYQRLRELAAVWAALKKVKRRAA